MNNRIKLVRSARGYSRAELSRLSAVPVRTLEGWELGARIPRDVYQLMRVAGALGCLVEDLVSLDDFTS